MRESEQQLHGRLRSDGDQRAVVGRHSRQRRSERRHAGAHRRRRADVRRRQRQHDRRRAIRRRSKWSPRVGAVYSLNTKTVLRGGYGLYWAPWNYPAPSSVDQQLRPDRLHAEHRHRRRPPARRPSRSTNPFPNGLVQPLGQRRRACCPASARRSASSIRTATAPRVQQFSVDLQRELPGAMAITVSYVGARGDHLPLGGTVDTPVNINQLDPKYLALGAAALSHAGAESVLRHRRLPGRSRRRRTLTRGAAAAAVSRSSATSTRGRSPRATTATTRRLRVEQAAVARAGAAASATPTAC